MSGTYWAEHTWDEYMMERELTGFETMANEKQQICFTAGFWKILAAQPGRLLAATSLLTQNTAENRPHRSHHFLAPRETLFYLYSLEVLRN